MLWRFPDETIEDLGANMLHRADCQLLGDAGATDVHPAGSSVLRDVAPRECWSCQPTVELVLGV